MNETSHNKRNLVIAIGGAVIAALAIFLALVLPAEFGKDPLGTGRLLGLSGLAGEAADALTPQYEVHRTDEVEFVLEPFQSLEYKYLMDQGNTLVFSWVADGELYYDMHAENTTQEESYEESYAEGNASQDMGAYEAAFNGMHGWFWENRGFDTITLRVKTAGFYVSSRIYRGGGTTDNEPPAVF